MEQAYHSAQQVYERMGQPNKLGMLAVPGFHGSNDIEASIDWLDWQFGRSKKVWVNHFVFPWDFNKWKAATREKINEPALVVSNAPGSSGAKAASDYIRSSIKWMLGDAPPTLSASYITTFGPGRGPTPKG